MVTGGLRAALCLLLDAYNRQGVDLDFVAASNGFSNAYLHMI